MKKINLDIIGLSYSQTQTGAYALVLGERNGKRRLPIIIGGFEAQAIAIELEKMTPSRPLTHDLFKTFATTFGIEIKEVVIYNLVEGIFFAKLICEKDGKEVEIDARTSDSIALAVRFNCPISTFEFILSSAGILLEDEQDFDDGVNIILDGTGTTTATARTINFTVYVADDGTGLQNVFYINSVKNPVLTLEEGNTYYFDLSNVSLYNAVSTKHHQLKFSTTPDGTHGSGVAYTTGVTSSGATIDIGTAGAYVQITVAAGAPTLYYYCVNHSGMGNSIITPQLPTTIDNEGSAVIMNGESKHEFGIAIESGTLGNSTDLIELEGGAGVLQTEESILNFVLLEYLEE